METENSVDKEKYKACIDDIEVAKTEIKNMKYTQRMLLQTFTVYYHITIRHIMPCLVAQMITTG